MSPYFYLFSVLLPSVAKVTHILGHKIPQSLDLFFFKII